MPTEFSKGGPASVSEIIKAFDAKREITINNPPKIEEKKDLDPVKKLAALMNELEEVIPKS